VTGLAQTASPLSVGSLTQLTLSLFAIVALILAISWALKRLKLSGPRRSSGDISVLDELSLSPRDRIMLIRVGDSQVLVGIGASGLVSLSPLTAPIAMKNPAQTQGFAERLREMMKRPGGPP
jgi:flagellar protein FliO/FliZ